MFKRSLLIGLLALIVVAWLANETHAAIGSPIPGGYTKPCYCDGRLPRCVLCGKCVEGFVRATGLGNVEDTPTFVILSLFAHQVWVIDDACPIGCWKDPGWAVACGNPGSKNWESPGINPADLVGSLAGIASIEPGDVSHNGSAYVLIPTQLPGTLQDALGDLACPNENWIARDALPCEGMDGLFEEIIIVGASCYIRSTLRYNNCYIEGCLDTVKWDKVNQTFKPVPYRCPDAPISENLKPHILYSDRYPEYNCPAGICATTSDCDTGQTCVDNVCTTT